VGDPDRGFGRTQPGGWVYNVLPFIEQGALSDLGKGFTDPAEKAEHAKREATPVAIFNCPSRRRPLGFARACCTAKNTGSSSVVARSCYAANMGDANWTVIFPSITLADGENSTYVWPHAATITGISFMRSEISSAAVRDGLSNTYLIGEKLINPDHYLTGQDGGDDWSMYSGQQDDIYRLTYNSSSSTPFPPLRDRPGIGGQRQEFGGPHAAGCQFAMADGSVHNISFSIDAVAHRNLGNRKDGNAVDVSAF
jgi:hypothetical protein